MTREAVERELREKLTAHRTRSGIFNLPLSRIKVDSLIPALLPWIMEMREDAAAQARIDDGQLP